MPEKYLYMTWIITDSIQFLYRKENSRDGYVSDNAHVIQNQPSFNELWTRLVVGDGDLVLLAGGLVAGRHVQDTVGIDVKGHLKHNIYRLNGAKTTSESRFGYCMLQGWSQCFGSRRAKLTHNGKKLLFHVCAFGG